MSLVDPGTRYSFGGHEKFVFRHGWLKKGVDAARKDPFIFTREDALVTLGVGKNMVRSIRFWCMATDLLVEAPNSKSQVRPLQPSELADRLLSEKGWDPFLEDTGTLWLLHWLLISNPMRTLVWRLTFSTYLVAEFTKKQLMDYIGRQLDHLGIRTTPAMIEREVDCCLRTYVPARLKSGALGEESLDCPLAELDLIRFMPEDAIYRFNVGPKTSLPVAVFGYALADYLERIITTRRTVAVDECIYQPGSPGQAFKLDENSVVEYLEKLEEQYPDRLSLRDTAGLRQIYLQNALTLKSFGLDVLNQYYERN